MTTSSPLLIVLGLGALSASLALLMARLHLSMVADVCAIGAALLGLTAFIGMAVATVRSARRLPWGPHER